MKSRRKVPTPEWENIQVDTNVQGEGFGEILKESTYARAGNALVERSRSEELRMDMWYQGKVEKQLLVGQCVINA